MKTFQEYIKESGEGVAVVVDKPINVQHEPDIITPIPNIKTTGHSTSVPMHWGGSKEMSKGLGFGANPKGENRVLSYADFMKTAKGFSEKENDKK